MFPLTQLHARIHTHAHTHTHEGYNGLNIDLAEHFACVSFSIFSKLCQSATVNNYLFFFLFFSSFFSV